MGVLKCDTPCRRISNVPFNSILLIVETPHGKSEVLASRAVVDSYDRVLKQRALEASVSPPSSLESRSSSFRKASTLRRRTRKKSKRELALEEAAAAAEAAEKEAQSKARADAAAREARIASLDIPAFISEGAANKYRTGVALCGGDATAFTKLLEAHARVAEARETSKNARCEFDKVYEARSPIVRRLNKMVIEGQRTRELRDRVNVIRSTLAGKRQRIESARAKLLDDARAFQDSVVIARKARAERLATQKKILRDSRRERDRKYSLMRARESQLLTQLCSLLPLHVKEGRVTKHYFIRGLELPHLRSMQLYPSSASSGSSASAEDVFEESHIATALGYVCQLVFFLSKYLRVPLRYLPVVFGSSSSMCDFVAVDPAGAGSGDDKGTSSKFINLGDAHRDNTHLPPPSHQKLLTRTSAETNARNSSLNALYAAGLLTLPEGNGVIGTPGGGIGVSSDKGSGAAGFADKNSAQAAGSTSRRQTIARAFSRGAESVAESTTSSNAAGSGSSSSRLAPSTLISPLSWKGIDRASRVHKVCRAWMQLRADIDQIIMTRARFGTLMRMRRKREAIMDKLDEDLDSGITTASCIHLTEYSLLACRRSRGYSYSETSRSGTYTPTMMGNSDSTSAQPDAHGKEGLHGTSGGAGDSKRSPSPTNAAEKRPRRRRSRTNSSFEYPSDMVNASGAPHVIALLKLLLNYEMQRR